MTNRDNHLGIDRTEEFVLWRYMDLTKFMLLLFSKSLYLRRADLFEDRFEGSLSLGTINAMGTSNLPLMARTMLQQHFESRIYQCYVSCWHEAPHESMALWKIYGDAGAVAIRSSYRRLRSALPCLTDDALSSGQGDVKFNEMGRPQVVQHLDIGRIRYLDYDTAVVPNAYVWSSLLCKRIAFEYEKEVRIFVLADSAREMEVLNQERMNGNHDGDSHSAIAKTMYPQGIEVPINLDNVIEAIYLSPLAKQEMMTVVLDACTKHGLSAELVRPSSLVRVPPRI